ncbi:MAG: hypothetical protein GY711_23550 [bacterium]|nr:hypothetical protein [bacterium]
MSDHDHSGNDVPAHEVGSLDKVREILFGARSREQEQRVESLGSELAGAVQRLRTDMDARFDASERKLKGEVERIDGQVRDEIAARRVGEAEQRSLLEEMRQALDERIAQVDEHAKKSLASLDARLLAVTSEMRDEYETRIEALSARVDDTTADLESDKVSRVQLASFFAELSRRLGEPTEG